MGIVEDLRAGADYAEAGGYADPATLRDAADMLEFLFGKMGWVDLVGDTPEANVRAAVRRIKEETE